MSYGIIRAWKGASEFERMEEFLTAVVQTNTEYLEKNCASDIEFVDVTDNVSLTGIIKVSDHLVNKWNLGNSNFEISNIEMSYTDSSEVASFTLGIDNQEFIGLAIVEEKNGRISLCRMALMRP